MSATLEADSMTPQEITKLEKSLAQDVTMLSQKRERKAALEQQVVHTHTYFVLLRTGLCEHCLIMPFCLSLRRILSFMLSLCHLPGQVTHEGDQLI